MRYGGPRAIKEGQWGPILRPNRIMSQTPQHHIKPKTHYLLYQFILQQQ